MGFKVVRDFVKDKGEKGTVGVESIPPTHWLHWHFGKQEEDYTYKGGQIKVRLLDDDGHVCCHALVDETDFSCELLLDWGTGFAGCTRLDLSMKDWNEESGGRKHPYPTKDGKWVYYMG